MTDPSHIEMTRQELLDLVWSKPMPTLVTDYGISDVGMVKICKKHNVPRPPQGHWARARKRRRRKPKLPRVDAKLDLVRVPAKRTAVEEEPGRPPLSDDATAAVAAAKGFGQVTLPDTLRGAHALVRERARPAVEHERAQLVVRVAKTSLRRALYIVQALVSMAEALGGELLRAEHGENEVVVLRLLGVDMSLCVTEEFRAAKREEVEEPAPDDWRPHPRPTVGTGRLTVEVTSVPLGRRRTIHDRHNSPIEARLHKFPLRLVRLAIAVTHELREIADRRRRWEEEARRSKERERRKQIAAARAQALRDDAEAQRRAEDLLALVDAVEREVEARGHDPNDVPRVAEWTAWVRRQAAGIDPTSKIVDDLLEGDGHPQGDDPWGRHRRW